MKCKGACGASLPVSDSSGPLLAGHICRVGGALLQPGLVLLENSRSWVSNHPFTRRTTS